MMTLIMSWYHSLSEKLIGETLVSAAIVNDQFVIETDKRVQVYDVEGDCCSYSWVEHITVPDFAIGKTITKVDDSGNIVSDHGEHDDGGEIAVYNSFIRTDGGDVVLEYRNSSNGYYGGYMTLVSDKPKE